jgi:hypothetical protein
MRWVLFQAVLLAGAVAAGFWGRGRMVNVMPVATVLDVSEPPRALTEWYYADGRVNPDNVDPNKSPDLIRTPAKEWLVLYNPGELPVHAAVTFYFAKGNPLTVPKDVPAHGGASIPVFEHVPADMQYGVRVRSDRMIIVQPSRGEYIPGSPVTQAMASFIAHPGPLGKRETKWVYADGLVLKNETDLEEWEWVSILNPDESRTAKVVLKFESNGNVTTHELSVSPQRVASVDLMHLDAFPKNKLVGVTTQADIPIVVQQIRRAYKKGETTIAAMWACLAFPVGDD